MKFFAFSTYKQTKNLEHIVNINIYNLQGVSLESNQIQIFHPHFLQDLKCYLTGFCKGLNHKNAIY